ncbi:N-acetyltransferase [Pseudoalteromonas sp. SR43-6]|uniref:N-acetyltransferase n=1 Tax=unclassified Pseudoalteromonas TaxID=194690 RepID=UPI0015FD17C0|nr:MULTISPECIES: N-acetyltransferase [unclassified Pseudoalteromonas]MBB1287516.1 N-acetyltransferase [Pseudoalteromonas sp. SR41-5]MBB1373354.1 N-acetyltransferase [Pseudoalteromonas sp. SR43-6]MBB1412157.1 N-acetyltransferase [Pseudoalteromonas sp. SG43-8]
MKTIIKSPSECSLFELDTFEKMAVEGGQVSPVGLRSRVKQAEKLIFIWQGDACVAIAGLKNPLQIYKSKVFKAAGVSNAIEKYKCEIGYIYAKVNGVGNQLMEGVLDASEGYSTFATTQDTNEVMQHLLPKFGFVKLGNSYLNDKKEYYLGLFGNET